MVLVEGGWLWWKEGSYGEGRAGVVKGGGFGVGVAVVEGGWLWWRVDGCGGRVAVVEGGWVAVVEGGSGYWCRVRGWSWHREWRMGDYS